MFGLFTKTLRRRIISLMIAVSIILVGIVLFFSIKYSSDALYNVTLKTITDDLHVTSEALVHESLVRKVLDLEHLIGDGSFMGLVDKINQEIDFAAISDTSRSYDTKAHVAELDRMMSVKLKEYSFVNIFILDSKGKIIYDYANKNRVGIDFHQTSDPIMIDSIEKAINSKMACFSDLERSPFNSNLPSMYLSKAEYHADGKLDQIIVIVLDTEWLRVGLDDFSTVAVDPSVDIHIVGLDGKVRLSKNRSANSTNELGASIKSEIIDNLIKEKKWSGMAIDEEGVDVIASTIPFDTSIVKQKNVDINFDFKWGLSMEVPTQVVFAPIYKLIRDICIVGIILIIIFAIVAFFFANSISKPISSASMQLSSSMQEIAATITQLSSSVSETTVAVNEITSTIEEIRQISSISNRKAEDMAGKAESVRSVADEGKTSTEKVSVGILEINKQVETIATTTIKLGEQTKNISEIIDSVTDIADQSNLLSVNASIEAAKAGEYGRGFAVVAREIKTLADKSKESTKQIREILTEIQKSASSAILATEKGTKTVNEGLSLSNVSKASIEKLEVSVGDAVDTSSQIVNSSKELHNGMNQLFETVGNIRKAMQLNSESITQLSTESRNLSDMAIKLKDLINKVSTK